MAANKNPPIWVADSETDPFKHGEVPEPFVWGIYDGTDYQEFWGSGPAYTFTYADTKKFVEFLSPHEVIIYAHNGGKFDWHFLSPFFEAGQELLIIHGRLARFKIGNCEFRDSFNLMPVSLEQYNKMRFDYSKMLREHRADHVAEISEYLRSDCENLFNMVSGFNETYGVHITQASAAMHYWTKKLGNKVPRSGPTFYDTFKDYYYGGRVQCFEQGDFLLDCQSVDINSAYPYAMLQSHPYSLEYRELEGPPRKGFDKWGPMLFSVRAIAHGCFPYRATNGSLYFPDDDTPRYYDVTGWELMAAVETETVDDLIILKHFDFDETRDFGAYVNHFWNLRKEFKANGDKGGEFYCKIFLNALYGKFATDPRKHKNYTLRHGSDLKKIIEALGPDDSWQNFREWIIEIKSRDSFGKNQFYNLATAASITGFVRAMLWRAVCGATRPLYCDTDSITAVAFGDGVHFSDELGDWGIEHDYDRCVIAGKKLYAFHKTDSSYRAERAASKRPESVSRWKLASKGARLKPDDLIAIANGEAIHFKNDAPTFSASKPKPVFIDRHIQRTAADIRIVPRDVDPIYLGESK